LKSKLNKLDNIRKHVNKFIAHSATPESRQKMNADEIALTLERLWQAHKAICETATSIDLCLFTGAARSFLAIYEGDIFEYIDRPLITSDKVGKLREEWEKYQKETDSWGGIGRLD